ncbi:hypothetical protein LAY41_30045 [Argonema galeatum A003/A1]|nr:hypothetical protein [Argonema galeatum A003/A1]
MRSQKRVASSAYQINDAVGTIAPLKVVLLSVLSVHLTLICWRSRWW